MVKVQDFIRFLKSNFGIKITKNAYHTYDGCYFLSDMKKIKMGYVGDQNAPIPIYKEDNPLYRDSVGTEEMEG